MQRASGGLLRTALALATLACVSSLYEDQVMPVPAPRRCVLMLPRGTRVRVAARMRAADR
jgi:hypothetical protein